MVDVNPVPITITTLLQQPLLLIVQIYQLATFLILTSYSFTGIMQNQTPARILIITKTNLVLLVYFPSAVIRPLHGSQRAARDRGVLILP